MKRRIGVQACLLLAGLLRTGDVEAACTISTTSVSFGAYNVLGASPVDSTGSVTLKCLGMEANITIDLNKGGSSTFTPRRMVNGGELLTYNLYVDASRATIWGDGTGGTSRYSNASPPNNSNVIVVVYGRIPAAQDVTAGSYADTVTATITW
jgi:spore coat protein U domain-containing protein, fimbrial subunit CupE1/2/3/6